MRVKNGIASSRSFDRMPNTRSGKVVRNSGGNTPIDMATAAAPSPRAPSENATGKPISRINTMPANIAGAIHS